MYSIRHQSEKFSMAAVALTMLPLFFFLAAAVRPAPAQTFTLLYSFQGTASNYGAYPMGLVQGTDGNLYGVTAAGGDEFDSGVFFKINTSGDEKLICSFYDPGACRDAQAPSANLVEGTNGDFYGVALDGEIIRLTTHGKLKESVEAIVVEETDPHVNALGIKGVGEIGVTGSAGAVANAVWHATGVRVRKFPITLDRLIEPQS